MIQAAKDYAAGAAAGLCIALLLLIEQPTTSEEMKHEPIHRPLWQSQALADAYPEGHPKVEKVKDGAYRIALYDSEGLFMGWL